MNPMSERTEPFSRPPVVARYAPLARTRSLSLQRCLWLIATLRQKRSSAILTAFAIATAGCHKKTDTPSIAPGSQQGQPGIPSSARQEAQPGDAAVAPQPLGGEVDPFMTSQLRIFIEQKGRLPANFTELANTRLDSVPRTRPGTMWAIDPVTQEVKLVNK